MKSIIVISTILFVTASFMGIANYLRYNQSLSEEGLYAAPAVHAANAAEEGEVAPIPAVAERLADHNQNEKEEVVVQQSNKVRKQTGKKRTQTEVYHAAKKPREREINFKEFSRAPLDDYSEITEPIVNKKEEALPVEHVENK
jgi:hypothetical protein